LLAPHLKSAPLAMGLGSGVAVLPGLSGADAEQLARKLATLGVNLRFENIRGFQMSEPFGPPRPEWALMKQIKAALDPQGILNPGRFVV
jgi:hypothetical protein